MISTRLIIKSTVVITTLLALAACETKVSSPVVRFSRQVSYDAVQASPAPASQSAATQQQAPVADANKP